MGEALEQYVDKKNTKAIEEIANDVLKENEKILTKGGSESGHRGQSRFDTQIPGCHDREEASR